MTDLRTSRRAPWDDPSRDSALRAWRARVMVRAGFGVGAAIELAEHDDLDVHALLTLLDRGCPPELAARILAR
ncbi:hypothetical protein ATK30_0344 [Amycolatopsis echigonensis]|uniref:Uncharacterized protein n=1 Tax=Amycolatopsis echigonensis TaxID=2576905 RepID=A0A2N3X2A0_9PSEU|nr:hypothetical protein [Amycolatopsis niigatensis]PKW00247.1 hypothetical protein ATK30_0344 [Amycolatopsis niigatensis]